MDTEAVKQILEGGLAAPQIQIAADGNKVEVHIVSASFDGLSRVKRQQLVYGLLGDMIKSGEIHALMMKTQTPDEVSG